MKTTFKEYFYQSVNEKLIRNVSIYFKDKSKMAVTGSISNYNKDYIEISVSGTMKLDKINRKDILQIIQSDNKGNNEKELKLNNL